MPEAFTPSRWCLPLAACVLVLGCTPHRPLSPPNQRAFELSLAAANGQLAAAWHGGPAGDAIWMRLADGSARPLGSPIRLTDGSRHAYEPDIEPFDGDFLLAWYEKDPAEGSLTALAARFGAEGERRWLLELSAPGRSGRNPVIRSAGDTVWVAWIETEPGGDAAIWTARLDVAGALRESPTRRTPASADTWNLNADLDESGTFHVIYDAQVDTRANELHLLSIAGDGARHTALSSDDGFDSTYPDLAIAGGRAAITWLDARDGITQVHLFAGPLAELDPVIDTRSRQVTATGGPSTGAYLAWNGDRIGLVWCDASTGQSDLFSQRFDARGSPLSVIVRLTDTSAHSSIPAIELWKSGFAIAWNEYQAPPTSATGLHQVTSSVAMLRVVE